MQEANELPPELQEHWGKIASPANVAVFASRGDWLPAQHLLYLNRALVESLTDDEQSFLNIQASVRHGKSELITVWTVVWALGIFPGRRILIVCATADLAERFSRRARDLFTEWGPILFGKQVKADVRAVDEWETSDDGAVRAVGVGGMVTGMGFDCLPEGTLIGTPNGPIQIETLARDGGTVYGYDHEEQRIVERPIIAAKETVRADLVELRFTSGRTIRCTTDHRIFVEGRGYVRAGLVEAGAQVPALRGVGLPRVRDGVHAARLRLRETDTQDGDRACVLSGVSSSGVTGALPMREVWNSYREGRPSILRSMSAGTGGGAQGGANAAVRRVRHSIPSVEHTEPVLLAGMRERGARSSDDGSGERPLQGWDELLQSVQVGAPDDPRAGWGMHRVWDHRPAGHPSHRRESTEQRPDESGHVVRLASHDAPQVEYDTVSVVRHIRGDSHRVYDLTVDGTHNFFADGLLTHNCIIIDDPLKDQREARSDVVKNNLVEWYSSTLRTRLQPKGTLIFTMARWTEDDLSATVVEAAAKLGSGDPWRIIKMPALAECPKDEDPEVWHDFLGRAEGDALWPEMWPTDALIRIRDSLPDVSTWQALYQQNPRAKSGDLFVTEKWVRIETEPLNIVQKVRGWDLAGSSNKGDWTVGVLLGRTTSRRTVVLDVRRHRFSPSAVEELVSQTAIDDGFETKIRMELPKGDAHVTDLHYSKLLVGYDYKGTPVVGNKEARAELYASNQNRGLVDVLDRYWTDLYLSEHAGFPRGKHDDQIDASSVAFNALWADGDVEFAEVTSTVVNGLDLSGSVVRQVQPAWGR